MANVDLRELTDDAIIQMATEEWLGVLSRLWTAYDKPIDPDRLGLYRDMLGKIPLGLLELAIERVVKEHLFNSVPIVAQVWAAVRKELHNPHDIDRAIEDWCEASWRRYFVTFESVAVETEVIA